MRAWRALAGHEQGVWEHLAFVRHLFSQQVCAFQVEPEAESTAVPSRASFRGRKAARQVLESQIHCCLSSVLQKQQRIPWAFPSWSLVHLQGWEQSKPLIWSTLKRAKSSFQHSWPVQVLSAPLQELWWGCSCASACVGLELGAAVPSGCWGAWEGAEAVLCCFHSSEEALGKIPLLCWRGDLLRGCCCVQRDSPGMELFLS